ncbi:MAG: preprotein translocase subunit SecY [Candidatus Odinarchaeota archaeon]
MTSKFLQVMRPFMSITPEVVKPDRAVKFNEKIAWTIGALVIYFVMTTIPLFGVVTQNTPFEWLRTIMAQSKGSLAELGIGPIVTAGLIMQILTGSKIINVDMSDPEERALYTGAQKVLSVGMTLFEAIAYIVGGAYGPVDELGTSGAILVIIQLMAAGIVIILLDEMIQKGWGLGSGISLFIAGGVATDIMWNAFAFAELEAGETGGYSQGAIWALIQKLGEGNFDPVEAFFRPRLPSNSVLAVVATIVVFMVVIYFESMRVEIPVSHAQHKGMRGKYPIKLLYVSNIPVILVSAVFADVYFISQMLANAATGGAGGTSGNILIDLIGKFTLKDGGLTPSGGLVYFMTPPRGLIGAGGLLGDPLLGGAFPDITQLSRSLIYGTIMIGLCIVFSMMWIETAGMAPKDVAKQLIGAGMQIPGWRRSEKIIEKRLEMYIPQAAFIGGIFIGVLAVGADYMGALGTGTGILLSVSIMRQYFDILVKERAAEMHPALRDFLGIM